MFPDGQLNCQKTCSIIKNKIEEFVIYGNGKYFESKVTISKNLLGKPSKRKSQKLAKSEVGV